MGFSGMHVVLSENMTAGVLPHSNTGDAFLPLFPLNRTQTQAK